MGDMMGGERLTCGKIVVGHAGGKGLDSPPDLALDAANNSFKLLMNPSHADLTESTNPPQAYVLRGVLYS